METIPNISPESKDKTAKEISGWGYEKESLMTKAERRRDFELCSTIGHKFLLTELNDPHFGIGDLIVRGINDFPEQRVYFIDQIMKRDFFSLILKDGREICYFDGYNPPNFDHFTSYYIVYSPEDRKKLQELNERIDILKTGAGELEEITRIKNEILQLGERTVVGDHMYSGLFNDLSLKRENDPLMPNVDIEDVERAYGTTVSGRTIEVNGDKLTLNLNGSREFAFGLLDLDSEFIKRGLDKFSINIRGDRSVTEWSNDTKDGLVYSLDEDGNMVLVNREEEELTAPKTEGEEIQEKYEGRK